MKYKKFPTKTAPLIPIQVGIKADKKLPEGGNHNIMRLVNLYACPHCHRVVEKLYQFTMPQCKAEEGTYWYESWCIACIKKNKIKRYEELCSINENY